MSNSTALFKNQSEPQSEGGEIMIRPISPEDEGALCDAFDRLSCQSVYNRFFENKISLSEAEINHYVRPDFIRHVALVAELGHSQQSELVASARYFIDPENPRRAEIACTVIDDYQNRGIGGRMIRHLAAIARKQGICEFVGTALIWNDQVLRMLRSATSSVEYKDYASVREFHIDLTRIRS